jgi:hypothetical protein
MDDQFGGTVFGKTGGLSVARFAGSRFFCCTCSQHSSAGLVSVVRDEVSTGSGSDRVVADQQLSFPGCYPVATAPGTDSITSATN